MPNRQIKFRAWDTGHKKMWSAEEMGADELTINPDGRGFVNVNSASTRLSNYLPHMIPLQFTGLLDQNGKEIYEGDIIQHPDLGIVPIRSFEAAIALGIDGVDWSYTTVIGNIYQNPELVK